MMTVNQRIIQTVNDIAPCYAYSAYVGSKDSKLSEYFVFNYTVRDKTFGDNGVPYEYYSIQLHFYCPPDKDTYQLRREIRQRIRTEFCSPEEVDASDSDGQHYVFEFEALGTIYGNEDEDG